MTIGRRTFLRVATGSGVLFLTGTGALSCADTPSVAFEPWSGPSPLLSDEDVRLRIVSYALLAPSFRNTQPWWVDLKGDGILVRPEMHRVRDAIDPGGRNTLISLGAFIEALSIAASAFGYELHVEPLPGRTNGEPLSDTTIIAACMLGIPEQPPKDPLFDQILLRRTNRGIYTERPLESRHVKSLQSTRIPPSVSLELITERIEVERLSSIVHAADLGQYDDQQTSASILSHLRWTSEETRLHRDGMTMENAGIPTISRLWLRLLGAVGATDQATALDILSKSVEGQTGSAAAYGILSTTDDGHVRLLDTGRALMRIYLRAASEGVALQPFSSVLDGDARRSELRAALSEDHHGFVQILFRLGYGPDVPPSPRRSLFEIVRI